MLTSAGEGREDPKGNFGHASNIPNMGIYGQPEISFPSCWCRALKPDNALGSAAVVELSDFIVGLSEPMTVLPDGRFAKGSSDGQQSVLQAPGLRAD